MSDSRTGPGGALWPFLGGFLAGAAGGVLLEALSPRRGLDPSLIRARLDDPDVPLTVIVPGILGSELLRPDGTRIWLNFGNTIGSYDLSLPMRLPLSTNRDDLVPGDLLGAERYFPKFFGFSEYADLLELLGEAGFRRTDGDGPPGAAYHVFSYDWRHDLVESARRLHESLEFLAERRGDPRARFNVVGHSMGGLVARYYLRYGTAEPTPDQPVTWAGAQRIQTLTMVAVPNSGGIASLDTVLNGARVGFSSTTLSATAVAGMPSIYQLLPPAGTHVLLDERCETVPADIHDPAVWERYGWGPFRDTNGDDDAEEIVRKRAFVTASLRRAGAFHAALARKPDSPCPARVIALGGDCLPTLTRAIVSMRNDQPPRFEPASRTESLHMFEAGDGRVTRGSVLANHLPGAADTDTGSGLPEVSQAFFGSADHHGIYSEPTFQSVLLRLLLRPVRRRQTDAVSA